MYIYFLHSFMDGHLGYFCILAIVNTAAVNIGGADTSSGFHLLALVSVHLRNPSLLLAFLSSWEGLLTCFSALAGCRMCFIIA